MDLPTSAKRKIYVYQYFDFIFYFIFSLSPRVDVNMLSYLTIVLSSTILDAYFFYMEIIYLHQLGGVVLGFPLVTLRLTLTLAQTETVRNIYTNARMGLLRKGGRGCL